MIKRMSVIVVAAVAVLACGGCGTVAKQGMGLLGAKVRYLPLGPALPAGSPVTDVVCEPLANDVPTLAPAEFTGLVADALAKAGQKNKFFPAPPHGATPNVMTVRGQLIHYQPHGQNTYAVARVELVVNNQVIATAHCVSRGDSLTNSSTGKMASGLARAIVKFVSKTLRSDAQTRPAEDEDEDQDK